MKHRLAFDRTHAFALVGVLALHSGLLYALWSIRVPAQPDEAKILFVDLVAPAPATPAAERPLATAPPTMPAAAPAPRRPDRKAEPEAKPDQPEVVPKVAPTPKAESVPADVVPAELVAPDAAATSPAEAIAPPPSTATARADDGGNVLEGPQPGAAPGGPVTLASELALVCSERRAPPYPSISRRLGETGRVVLRVELDASGRVVQAQVSDSSGFARLDAAALAAVRNWRCEPPRRDGQAVGAVALQPFDFTLDGP